MPNWCDNTIIITGEPVLVKGLKEFVGRAVVLPDGEVIEKPIYSLANIMPSSPDSPPFLGEAFKSSGQEDWYHNNINSWGTKWDVSGDCYMNDYKEGDNHISYSYQSAWSPPTPTTQRLSEIFPELTITHKYYESGMDFWGIQEYQGGEQISEEGGELCHTAWVDSLKEDCWNCNENDDPEYWYSDCPSAIEAKKKKKKKEKKKVSA